MERDHVAEAHLIARAAPGLGHPFDLTCGEFDAHLRLSVQGHSGTTTDGANWMRRYVERR